MAAERDLKLTASQAQAISSDLATTLMHRVKELGGGTADMLAIVTIVAGLFVRHAVSGADARERAFKVMTQKLSEFLAGDG